MPYFEVTYADGTIEEIEADELRDSGATYYLTFVNYRVLLVTTVHTEIVRRLDRCALSGGRRGAIGTLQTRTRSNVVT